MKLKQDGNLDLIKGLYAPVPLHRGRVATAAIPVIYRERGHHDLGQNNRSTMAYGIDTFNARNPLAWPSFAQRHDVEACPQS
jgi:acetyl esterase